MTFDHLDTAKFADERYTLGGHPRRQAAWLPRIATTVQLEAEALVRAARKDAHRQGGGRELPAGVQPLDPRRAWR